MVNSDVIKLWIEVAIPITFVSLLLMYLVYTVSAGVNPLPHFANARRDAERKYNEIGGVLQDAKKGEMASLGRSRILPEDRIKQPRLRGTADLET